MSSWHCQLIEFWTFEELTRWESCMCLVDKKNLKQQSDNSMITAEIF